MLVWFVDATKSQRTTAKSHAATLSRDEVAQQNRAIKSQKCDIGLRMFGVAGNWRVSVCTQPERGVGGAGGLPVGAGAPDTSSQEVPAVHEPRA